MLPRDTGSEVEFNILPLIMFDSTPGSDMEIISNPINGMDHPVLKLPKRDGKMRILDFSPNLYKKSKYGI